MRGPFFGIMGDPDQSGRTCPSYLDLGSNMAHLSRCIT
jgi:hypothetical protein